MSYHIEPFGSATSPLTFPVMLEAMQTQRTIGDPCHGRIARLTADQIADIGDSFAPGSIYGDAEAWAKAGYDKVPDRCIFGVPVEEVASSANVDVAVGALVTDMSSVVIISRRRNPPTGLVERLAERYAPRPADA